MKRVEFRARGAEDGTRDGEGGWDVFVDGALVIEDIDDLDVGNRDFDPLWAAMGAVVEFNFD
jgi:hypothetical protein